MISQVKLPNGQMYQFDDEEKTPLMAYYEAKELFPDAFVAPSKPSSLRRVADIGVAGIKSTVAVPEAAIGLLDIPTMGAAGKAAEKLGIRFDETQRILSDLYSPQQKAANAAVENAEGFINTLAAYATNPSTIATTVGESLMPMLAGGVAARGIKALAKVGDVVAAAAGEGAIMTGGSAEQIRQQTESGYLEPYQVGAALGTGIVGGAMGGLGGKAAQKLGVFDPDVLAAGGSKLSATNDVGFIRRVVGGGISEGAFEELPQSVQEQMWQNYALDKPIMEGVEKAAASGLIAGGAMGAGVNVFRGAQPQATAPEVPPPSPQEYVAYPQATPSEYTAYTRATPSEYVARPTGLVPDMFSGVFAAPPSIPSSAAPQEVADTVTAPMFTTPRDAAKVAQPTKQAKAERYGTAEPSVDSPISPDGTTLTAGMLSNIGIHKGTPKLRAVMDDLLMHSDMAENADYLRDVLAGYEEGVRADTNTARAEARVAGIERIRAQIAAAEQKKADIEAAYAAKQAAAQEQERAQAEMEMEGKGLAGLGVLTRKSTETEAAYAQRQADMAAQQAAEEEQKIADEAAFTDVQKEMAVPGTQFGLLGEITPPAVAQPTEDDTVETMDFANKRDFPGQSTLFKRNMTVNPQAVQQEKKDAIQIESPAEGVLRPESQEPQVDMGLQEVGKGDSKPQKAPAKGKVAKQEAVAQEVAPDPVATLAALSDISAKEKNAPDGKKARQYRQAAMKPDATETDLMAADAFVKDYTTKKEKPVEKATPVIDKMRAKRDELATKVEEAKVAAEEAKKEGKFAKIKNADSALAMLEMQKTVADRAIAKEEAKVVQPTKVAPKKRTVPARESIVIEQDLEDAKLFGTEEEVSALRSELAAAKRYENATRMAAKPSEIEKEGLAAAREAETAEPELDVMRDASKEDPNADGFQKLIAGSNTAGDALRVIASKIKDPTFKAFVSKLLANPKVANARLKLTDEIVIKAGTDARILGSYLPDSNVVVLHTGAGMISFMHEVTHARTYEALRSNPAFRNEVKNIYDAAKKMAVENGVNLEDQYGLSSDKNQLDEFVAEVFANPSFSRLLDDMYPTPKESLFQRFIRALAKAIGFPITEKNLGFVDSVVKLTDQFADIVDGPVRERSKFGISMLNVERTAPRDSFKKQGEAIEAMKNSVNTRTAGSKLDTTLLYTMTLNQIGEVYGRLFPKGGLRKVISAMGDLSSKRMEYLKKGEPIQNQFMRDIPFEFRSDVNAMMALATKEDVFVDKSFEENVKAGTLADVPTDRARYDGLRKQYEDLKKRMDAHKSGSGTKFEGVFRDMYNHGRWLYDEKFRIIEAQLGDVFAKQKAAALETNDRKKLAELDREQRVAEERMKVLRNRVKGPYFPLSRFGNFLVTTRSDAYIAADAEAKVLREALTKLEGNAALQEIEGLRGQLKVVSESRKKALTRVKGDTVSEAVTRLRAQEADMKSELAALEKEYATELEQLKAAREAFGEADAKLDAMKSDPAEFEFSAFESERDAFRHLDQQKALGKNAEKSLMTEYEKSESSPVTREFLSRLERSMSGTVDPAEAAKIRNLMSTIMVEMSMSDTIRRQLRRKNVAGYDPDMYRSFSKMVASDAHFLANLELRDKISGALTDLEAEANAVRGDNTVQKKVHNAMAKHIEGQADYAGKNLVGNVTAWTSAWMLLTSPAYVLSNMTQSWIVSLPMLAADFNVKTAAPALKKGLANAMRIIQLSANKGGETDFISKWSNVAVDPISVRAVAGDDIGDLVDHMLDRQLIDVSLSSDAGLNSNSGSTVREAVMKAVGAAPHLTEVANRIGTAIAAYELAKQERPNASKEELYQYVEKVLENTHFNYSSENEPLAWKRLPFAHLVLQFKKYQEGMLYLIFSNAAKAVGRMDATPEEQKAARATLAYLAGTHFLAAGAIGVPMSGLAMGIIDAAMSALGDGDDEPWKTEKELQAGVSAVFGDDIGVLVSKGLPAYMGLDLSQKLGAGDITSFSRFGDDTAQGKEWYKSTLVNAAGPFLGGLMPRAVEGANYLFHGDVYKGMEKLSPSLVSNAMKAYRYETEGLTTKYGNVAIAPEAFGPSDIFGRALGFTTQAESRYYEETGQKVKKETFYKEQATELKDMYIAARESGEGMEDVRSRLAEVNSARRAKGAPPIQFSQLVRAYQAKLQDARERNEYGVRVRRSEQWLTED